MYDSMNINKASEISYNEVGVHKSFEAKDDAILMLSLSLLFEWCPIKRVHSAYTCLLESFHSTILSLVLYLQFIAATMWMRINLDEEKLHEVRSSMFGEMLLSDAFTFHLDSSRE